MASEGNKNGNNKDSMSEKRKPSTPSESRRGKKPCSRDIFLNPIYEDEVLQHSLSHAFQRGEEFTSGNGAKVSNYPFPHCVLPDFLGPEGYVGDLQSTVHGLPFKEKHTDLYKLSQTPDFCSIFNNHNITLITNFLYHTFLPWVSQIVGCKLENEVDISASCYKYGDYLLCHNDQFEERKIAFIYYLASDWDAEDGGILELFDTCGVVPRAVRASVIPKSNLFIFFQVTSGSYHQVTEVLKDKSRYAISGWYHGEPSEIVKEVQLQLTVNQPRNHKVSLKDYVNPFYLVAKNRSNIRSKFEKSSEVQLYDFLKADVHEAVCKELRECNAWTPVGPPHKRSFAELDLQCSLPPLTKKLHQVLHSNSFLSLLSSIVGLRLYNDLEHDSCREPPPFYAAAAAASTSKMHSRPKCAHFTSQIRKLSHRSYSLLHDFDEMPVEESLDAFFFFNCEDWDESYGGKIVYVAKDDDEPLIDIIPVENSLSLVFHEKDVMYFTKYVNHTVNVRETPYYHCISSVFYDNIEDAADSDSE